MKRLFLLLGIVLTSCLSEADEQNNQVKASTVSDDQLIAHGNKLSAQAQKQLLSQVSQAIADGGTVKAIHYCNLQATALMDTISEESGAVIKRVALKNRNLKNYLKDGTDSAVFNTYKADLNSASELKPTVFRENGEVKFYKPILLQMSTCLKCHGSINSDIDENTLAAILKRYPDDKAVNFQLGDLRGLWKITFPMSALKTK